MFRRRFLRRGQVAVFYALMIPVFFFVGGVGLDLGWYYLNVSRLQNAADAAVLVGANDLVEREKINNVDNPLFKYKIKLVNKYPADKFATDEEGNPLINTLPSDKVAREYAMKNLAASDLIYAPPKFFSVAQAATVEPFKDGYTRGNPEVKMTTRLYQYGEDYYYVLHLTEDIHHFFIGFLPDMEAPVVAVAKLQGQTIIFDANGGYFENKDTTEEHSPIDWTKDFTSYEKGKPLHDPKSDKEKVLFKGYWTTRADVNDLPEGTQVPTYKDGLPLTEIFTKATASNQHDDILMDFLRGKTGSITFYAIWQGTPFNNKTLWEQMQYLIAKNVYNDYWYAAKNKYGENPYQNSFTYLAKYDVNGEVAYYTENIDLSTKDKWDAKRNIGESTHYYIDFYQSDRSELKLGDGVSKNDYGNIRRTHSLFNVDIAYPVRTVNGKKIYGEDPLYCRIEAEPYESEKTYIRQMVINVNVDNTDDDKRPLFFFYDGPDGRTAQQTGGGEHQSNRDLKPDMAKPVILNLNADFKGVLWMPDIPVVINGNGHKFEGFIIAKEFRYLDTTQGTQVEYSTKGRKTPSAGDPKSKIRINPATGDVYSKVAENNSWDTNNQTSAYNLLKNNNLISQEDGSTAGFNLSEDSCFKTFKIEEKVRYMYVAYDNNCKMIADPFYEYGYSAKDKEDRKLIPLFKLDEDGNEVRVDKWEDVKLFGKPRYKENGQEIPENQREPIPKQLTNKDSNRNTVRLTKDKNGDEVPSPLYDEAGKEVLFCDDYVTLTGSYTVLTLDRVADNSRDPKEFLLTKKANLTDTDADTDDWK
ncbi:MAG: Tad domain-containing protein [Quinella sp. 1Q5]|nr:Tad domain-containing protein [Quinella sp. 1Q5]